MTKPRMVVPLVILAAALFPARARAFNSTVHAEITKSALRFELSERKGTTQWLPALAADKEFAEELLVRATVDADYRSEMYLDTWFHKPFAGARSGANASVFTSMFHFINVAAKGLFWDFDGYAYRYGTRQGFDGYLGIPGLVVRGDVSPPLGGKDDAHPIHGVAMQPYNLGFKGDEAAWKKMFLGKNSVADAVFPPADVVAQTAFNAAIGSDEASTTRVESWDDRLVLATGIFKNSSLRRRYWRGEIKSLPVGFDLIGLAFHMAQDVTVPQHATGTADNCHQELEDMADLLACATDKKPDSQPYYSGSYTASDHECQALFDPALTRSLLATLPELDRNASMSVRTRVQALALRAARWQWGDPESSIDFLGTTLPDGLTFTADHCADLVALDAVKQQLRYEYNLAVAATVVILEQADAEAHPAARNLAQRLTLGFDRGP